MSRSRAALVLLCALALGRPLAGQVGGSVPASNAPRDSAATPLAPVQVARIVRTFLDNDLFALRDSGAATDFDYTHGMGAVAYWADAPAWVRTRLRESLGCATPRARETGCVMSTLGVRQEIYTPSSNSSIPVPGQRPHAGYLGVHAGLTHANPRRLRMLTVDLGMTGRPSLAEPLQQAIHAMTGSAEERGWRNQLGSRPAIALRYDEIYSRERSLKSLHIRGRALWGAQLGTLRTAGLVGGELQLARNLRRFWTPFDGGSPLPLGPYLLGGIRQERVARDLFVDGHFGDETITSVREPNVWQSTLGFGWRFPGGSSEYRYIRRGKEYRDQLGVHSHGSLTFTFHRR